MKIGVTMSDTLGKQVEEFAAQLNISRAGAVCVLCSQALSQNKAFTALPELLDAYKKEQGKQDKQDKQEKHG